MAGRMWENKMRGQIVRRRPICIQLHGLGHHQMVIRHFLRLSGWSPEGKPGKRSPSKTSPVSPVFLHVCYLDGDDTISPRFSRGSLCPASIPIARHSIERRRIRNGTRSTAKSGTMHLLVYIGVGGELSWPSLTSRAIHSSREFPLTEKTGRCLVERCPKGTKRLLVSPELRHQMVHQPTPSDDQRAGTAKLKLSQDRKRA
ncbi:hypothetical protein QBC43DRAFT_320964 [Cladorrhinum sp. PSN259]|nr:hypothetical protein QBC43DRAFT_320964 [Cladorrhinum sp. PSN259]